MSEFEIQTGSSCGPGDMSLLDWFAGQALTAMPVLDLDPVDSVIRTRATVAYTMAFAMMEERATTTEELRKQLKADRIAANAVEQRMYEEKKAREQEQEAYANDPSNHL